MNDHQRSLTEPETFWADAAKAVHWYKEWHTVLDDSKKPFYRWFVGGEVDCIRKTSSPRTFSSILTKVSPSGNGLMVDLPRSIPMYAQIASDKGLFEEPLKIFTIDYISFEQKPTEVEKKQHGL